jgi:hypothetical protein
MGWRLPGAGSLHLAQALESILFRHTGKLIALGINVSLESCRREEMDGFSWSTSI